jgi:hypothetical protein
MPMPINGQSMELPTIETSPLPAAITSASQQQTFDNIADFPVPIPQNSIAIGSHLNTALGPTCDSQAESTSDFGYVSLFPSQSSSETLLDQIRAVTPPTLITPLIHRQKTRGSDDSSGEEAPVTTSQVHVGRTFACPHHGCDATAKNQRDIARHLRTKKHQRDTVKSQSEGLEVFPCQYEDCNFPRDNPRRDNLIRHMRTAHGVELHRAKKGRKASRAVDNAHS